MALSYVTYPADGVTTQYDITFGYLARSHVFVFVDDQLRSFRWVTGNRVELNTAPNPGEVVKLQRLTDRVTRITDFVDGQTLLAGDLDAGDLQNFYIVQELLDEIYDGVITGTVPVRDPGTSFVSVQWIQDQLESNQLTSQAFAQLLQQITDEETARAQAITAEAQARIQGLADEALARANEIGNLAGTVAGNHAAFLAENQQRIDDIAAEATRLDGVVTRMDGAEAGILSNQQAISNEAGARTAEIAQANSRIDDVEADVTAVTNTQATDNQARIDDITAANAATAAAQADATSALSLVANEAASRVSEVSRLDVRFSNDPSRAPSSFADYRDWTHDLTGSPSQASDAPSQLFLVDPTYGPIYRTSDRNTVYQKTVHIVTPGETFKYKATINVEAIPDSGDCLCYLFAIALDGSYISIGGRIFGPNERYASTGEYVLEGELTADTISSIRAGAKFVRFGVEVLREGTNGTGQASLREFLVEYGQGVREASSAKATADSNSSLIASETAARASALENVRARFEARTGGSNLFDNGDFSKDPIGSTGIPTDWTNWAAGDQVVINEASEYPGKGVAYMSCPAGNQEGIVGYASGLVAGRKYLIQARVRRRGGTFKAAGVHLNLRNSSGTNLQSVNLSFGLMTSLEGQSGLSPDGTVTYATVVEAPAGCTQARAFLMAGWTTHGALDTGCDIDWYEFSVTPADAALAEVTELKDALATQSSSQARLFLGVNTANNEAFLEAFAGEGDGVWNGSKIRFKADQFEFGGDVIIDGDITADNLAPGAATKGYGTSSDSEMNPGNDVWTTIRSMSITTIGGLVYLHGSCDIDVYQAAAQSGFINAEVRLRRGSTVLRTRKAGGTVRYAGSQAGTAFYIEGAGDIMDIDQPGPGTYTYDIQVRLYNGSAGQGHRKVKNRALVALELRR